MRVLTILPFIVACAPTAQAPRATFPERDLDVASTPGSVQRTVLLSSTDGLVDDRTIDRDCRISVPDGAELVPSSDHTRLAARWHDELTTWNTHTCGKLATWNLPGLVGMAFAGSTRELVAVTKGGGTTTLVHLSEQAPVASQSIAGEPTKWAVSPDGTQAVVGTWDADRRRATLAIWSLPHDREPAAELELPVIERAVDSIAFAGDGRTATITVPNYVAYRTTTATREPWTHIAIDYDTSTWRSIRKLAVR
jgi:hypothetical protein